MSMYGEDDFVACLAFAGTPPHINHADEYLESRRRYHDAVETFCINWFEGKPIDGQWAGFFTAFLHWQATYGEGHV